MTTLPKSVLLALAMLAALPARARADDPSIQQRDAIEEYLQPNFVFPETSIWRFGPLKPYIGGERLVCGQVNFQSSQRSYLGFHRFYVTLNGARVTLAQIENATEDPSGKLRAKLDLLCGSA